MGLSENRCFEKRRKSSASVVEIFENIRIFERESKHGQNQGVGRRVVCQGKKRKQLSLGRGRNIWSRRLEYRNSRPPEEF